MQLPSKILTVVASQWCRPITAARGGGLCSRKDIGHTLNDAHFCIFEANVLVATANVTI